jgi:long-chain fatty acid transport protein
MFSEKRLVSVAPIRGRTMAVRTFGIALLAWASLGTSALGQGIVLPGAGPINRGMAGASTAAPTDFGASYWNPAILSGLDRQEFLLGSELIIPSIHQQTAIRAGSIGGRFPPENRFGLARSDSGVVPSVATGFALRLDDESPWTYGMGVFGFVGGNVNYAGSLSTPLLTPNQPPNRFGFGPIYGNASVLSLTPMASYQWTDRLAVGLGPVITSSAVSFAPAFFAPGPRDALGLPTFPVATNSRAFWGAGFQVGLFAELSEDWNVGFSYKSPVWQERWGFNAAFPDLAPRRIALQAEIPAIYSWGVAYKGFERTLIDVDLRYLDYAAAELFGQSVVDGGLGWRSVFAVAGGVQHQLNERLTVRGGYLYNTNPIPAPATLFNVQLPGIIQHNLSLGATWMITPDIALSLAWVHGFRASNEGSILQLPGSSVKFDAQTDSIVLGINVQFGGTRRTVAVVRDEPSGL